MSIAESKVSNIEYEYKILYAFSIIFIIASHCTSAGFKICTEFFPYYTFAISPFIFASGYFYNSKYEENVGNYILKKFKHLIIPLYLWNFFYGYLLFVLQNYWGFFPNVKVNLYNLFVGPCLLGEHFILNLTSWFIIPLFSVQVLNILVRKILRMCNIKVNEIIFCICCILLGCLGTYLGIHNLNTGFYLFIVRLLFFVQFFACGILYRKYKHYDKLNNVAYFAVIIGITLILYYFDMVKNNTPSYGVFRTNYLFMPFLSGMLGTAFWLRVSKILVPSLGQSKYIKLISDNTYAIMINHLLGFKLVETFFALLHSFTAYCPNFNMTKYKTMWRYCYTPHNLDQMLIIYLVVGIIFPILLQKFFKYCYKRFLNFCFDNNQNDSELNQ